MSDTESESGSQSGEGSPRSGSARSSRSGSPGHLGEGSGTDKSTDQTPTTPSTATDQFTTNSDDSPSSLEFDKESMTSADAAFDQLMDEDEVCPVTSLTGRDKKLIWDHWKTLTRSVEESQSFAISFVLWMLKNVPNMKTRFSNKKKNFDAKLSEDELVANEGFLKHATEVCTELNEILSVLPYPDKLLWRMNITANRHLRLKSKVGKEYFQPLHEKFDTFIGEMLNEETDSEIVGLWVKLMGALYGVVVEEEDKVDKENACCGTGCSVL